MVYRSCGGTTAVMFERFCGWLLGLMGVWRFQVGFWGLWEAERVRYLVTVDQLIHGWRAVSD